MKIEFLEKRIELLNFKDIFDSAKPYKTLLKAIFIGVGVFLRGGGVLLIPAIVNA